MRKHLSTLALLALLALLGAVGFGILIDPPVRLKATPLSSLGPAPLSLTEDGRLAGGPVVPIRVELRWGDTLETVLRRAGVSHDTAQAVVQAVRQVFAVHRFRAGSSIVLGRTVAGQLEWMHYQVSPDQLLEVRRCGPEKTFVARLQEIPSRTEVATFCGVLKGSLFESLKRLGQPPELAVRFAEIFAWDIDFYTDPQPGDEFCLVVERKVYWNGQPPTYGRILAARYNNAGAVYEGYLFVGEDGEEQYYAPDGKSLRAAFLRSPLKFSARVTSRFSLRRYHPILKVYRPHPGIDYAAPTGTPVQAIASGRVLFAGYKGGAGKMVAIRHANGFETRYLHLSRIYVRKGQKVRQGQVIGRVGASGLATGPHLDFRILKHGRYLNFERLKPPRARRLGQALMAEFRRIVEKYARLMDAASASAPTLLANEARSSKAAAD